MKHASRFEYDVEVDLFTYDTEESLVDHLCAHYTGEETYRVWEELGSYQEWQGYTTLRSWDAWDKALAVAILTTHLWDDCDTVWCRQERALAVLR